MYSSHQVSPNYSYYPLAKRKRKKKWKSWRVRVSKLNGQVVRMLKKREVVMAQTIVRINCTRFEKESHSRRRSEAYCNCMSEERGALRSTSERLIGQLGPLSDPQRWGGDEKFRTSADFIINVNSFIWAHLVWQVALAILRVIKKKKKSDFEARL